MFDEYVSSAEDIIDDPSNEEALLFVTDSALTLKNEIHQIVHLFEVEYQSELRFLRYLNYSMIVVSVIFTGVGLSFTRKIRLVEKYASYDYLTGLKTRRRMFEELSKVDIAGKSVFFIDLDKFKDVNDTYGHDIGDEILIACANKLTKIFGKQSVYRFGGDEFIVVKDLEGQFLDDIIKEVKQEFDTPIEDIHKNRHNIGCSVGVVSGTAVYGSIQDIITFADDLMYDSKNNRSKTKICVTYSEAIRRNEMKLRVNTVLTTNSMIAYFQPITNITGKIVGYEALARWKYNDDYLDPGEFMPLLKRSGMMEKLDSFMISEADDFYSRMSEESKKNITISVNISQEFLNSSNLNDNMITLDNFSIPRSHLMLEISEVTLMNPNNFNIAKELNDAGYSIIMDDFAAGVTTIDSLKFNFINRVKLDQSIVKRISDDQNVVAEGVAFLKSLGKEVSVEGIEKQEDFEAFKSLGIDYYQGYLFGRPRRKKSITL